MLYICIVTIIVLFIQESSSINLLRLTSNSKTLIQHVDLPIITRGTLLQSKKLQCVYKASRDGWSATDFHSKCDIGSPSLVIASARKGGLAGLFGDSTRIVGGYNPFGFTSADDYRNTNRAFVFCVDNGITHRCKKINSAEGAIYDFRNQGPIFGTDALRIPLNKSKAPIKSISSFLGTDYSKYGDSNSISVQRSTTTNNSQHGRSLLGCTSRSEMTELEVYVDAKVISSSVYGDVGSGIYDDFDWGGYGA